MIKNCWYAILESKELKEGRTIGVTRLSEKLVLWRDAGKVHCIYDQCCHRGASLSCGEVKDGNLQCPFHGFEYNKEGEVVHIPANGRGAKIGKNFRVHSYRVEEAYGFIWLWYGEDRESLPQIPFFDDLKSGFTYSSFNEAWNVHYTRAAENQLDVVHLPFVHRTTIGRSEKKLVNGPVVEWDGDLMTFYVKNEKDHGQRPEKPGEIENYRDLYSLQYHMPNIWQNRISDKVRVMAAFAPIDEENTMIYLRFYQSFAKLPIVKDLVNGLSNVFNRLVLHQDRRVVLTQLPKKSELRMGENLIQGDLPIIEFRKKRKELLNSQEDVKDRPK